MTNDTPKTIQIFLPHGDPRGIRVAEITTRIVQVIEVPRSLLPEFLKMPESDQVALYFLFGEAEDGADPKVYIGQTGDLRARLAKHNKEKEFWERALILISRTNSLTQTHALFLEWCCLQAARKAARYRDENGNSGSKPHTPAPLEADCREIYATGHTLLATLGYPIFTPVAKPLSATPPDELFYCRSAGVDGRGMYTEEGFVVLKGSFGQRAHGRSIVGMPAERQRQRLLESGTMQIEGETMTFERDHLFNSPSLAAAVILGRSSNGWIEWETKDGQTLDAVKRQNTRIA
ncbi:GIY-YIG nuclease family protein [Variovorax sp. M-6]|uniref:GIY-YIG nuclease family protein n=1 Tax=Variovorax sp. M-6 TaxID=3233041 RepID=UPI003F950F4A